MEREKVKDIKKALECCGKNNPDCDNCPYSVGGGSLCRQPEQEALSLINELESENEKLNSRHRNLKINYNKIWKDYREYEVENQQLKDRIAEIEKENEILRKHNIGYHVVNNHEAKEQLKQFAEILKENITVWYPSVIESIDQTLKEFIK